MLLLGILITISFVVAVVGGMALQVFCESRKNKARAKEVVKAAKCKVSPLYTASASEMQTKSAS